MKDRDKSGPLIAAWDVLEGTLLCMTR